MRGSRCVRLFLAVLAVVLMLTTTSAFAQHRSPYRTRVRLERVYELKRSAAGTKDFENIPTVRVSGRVYGVGSIDAHFNVKRNKTWNSTVRRNGVERIDPSSPVLLQGSMGVGGGWRRSGRRVMPTAASIIGNELKVIFPGRATGSRGSRQRVYTIRMTLSGEIVVTARVSSIPRSAGKRGACGSAVGAAAVSESKAPMMAQAESDSGEQPVVPPVGEVGEVGGTVLSKVVTISTDADPEWYQKYGADSNAVIASIINTAEAVYNRQLGIRFRIVQQHVYADVSPYTSTDSGRLLSAFTRNPDNAVNLSSNPATFSDDVDLKHLFTGKDIDGSVIGIAYIGVVCAVPTLAYGITQSYVEAANAGIFAHEVGHNFGANHDTSDHSGLMYPSVSIPPAQRFSDASMVEINGHLSKYGTCISVEEMAPRPDETPGVNPQPTPNDTDISTASLTLKKAKAGSSRQPVVRLSGKLLSASSNPITSVGIRLLVAGEEVARTVTSATGAFEFYVKMDLPKGKKVYVYVETEGGEIYSNFLWLGRTAPPQVRASRPSGRAHA